MDLEAEINQHLWADNVANYHHYNGFDIPVDLMMLTGGGPDTFDIISQTHMHWLDKGVGINSDHAVLEVGCGIGRDAIPLTEKLTAGSYVGVDIIRPSIEWCASNIGARNPRFTFHHFDVKDQLHNPSGTITTEDIRLPVQDQSIDRIILFSVFTHMLRLDIEHYLLEFKRVLKYDGIISATTFLYNDEILAATRKASVIPFDLRFEHEIAVGCRVNDLQSPLGAVAYTRDIWDRMVKKCGLRYAKPFLRGQWSGFYEDPDEGQDVAILGRA